MKRCIPFVALLAAFSTASIARAQLTTVEANSTSPAVSSPSKTLFTPPPLVLSSLTNSDEQEWLHLTSATVETDAVELDETQDEKEPVQHKARVPGAGQTDAADAPLETIPGPATLASGADQPLEEVSTPCGKACSQPCCPPRCCQYYNVSRQRTNFFGDYLFLRAHNVDTAYADVRNGLNPTTSTPAGEVGVVAPQFKSGFRVGGAYAIDPCSSFVTTFSWWQSSTGSTTSTGVPDSIHSLVTYPTTASAAANSLISNATYGIRFRTADAEYRRLLWGNTNAAINYSAGLRYAHLGQNFSAAEPITPGTTYVDSRIAYDGAGPRFGLDGERRVHNGFMIYGRTGASFLAGSFRSSYNQYNTFFLNQANVTWKDQRIVPILEAELGAGWSSCNGRVRITGGYYIGSWFNTVATPTWIVGAQTNNFTNVSQSIVFDGLVTRFEYCF